MADYTNFRAAAKRTPNTFEKGTETPNAAKDTGPQATKDLGAHFIRRTAVLENNRPQLGPQAAPDGLAGYEDLIPVTGNAQMPIGPQASHGQGVVNVVAPVLQNASNQLGPKASPDSLQGWTEPPPVTI